MSFISFSNSQIILQDLFGAQNQQNADPSTSSRRRPRGSHRGFAYKDRCCSYECKRTHQSVRPQKFPFQEPGPEVGLNYGKFDTFLSYE